MSDLTTADGHKIESCTPMTLYTKRGKQVVGEAHHYGGDGWQFGGMDGWYVRELYWDRLNALYTLRKSMQTDLDELDDQIDTEIEFKSLNKSEA